MDFFAKKLQKWYKINKRELPWRGTKDPYKIWLSEIILQQTQVVQGLSYYQKFVEHYPDIKLLAKARPDEVMKLWQGLGYYSRARNLHETAKIVADTYKGVFPKTYEEVRSLKGIGDYTAAAISSLAYDLPYAVVDGNVYRVLSRVFGVDIPIDSTEGKKYFQKLADELLNKKEPADYNQAVMEFGARYCRPVNPDCANCIFMENCIAFARKKVGVLPVKAKKTKIRNRYFNYVILRHKGYTYINKRSEKDIWQGLYEFHLIETEKKQSAETVLKKEIFTKLIPQKGAAVRTVSKEYKHVLSHQHLHARFFVIDLKAALKPGKTKKVKISTIHGFAFPRLIEKFLKENGVGNEA
jgi:A/G-specific adenine glycosylase